MKIVIPMSGQGSRFVKAGYTTYKPFILEHNIPIIEHVINLFPGEDDFIFICRTDLLETTNLKEQLLKLKPTATIVPCEPHKLGPVYTVTKAFHLIDDNEQVICNYCDFFMHWDYQDFKNTVSQNNCDGCIPCYTGFHPHLLHEKNLYAGCAVDSNQFLTEIKEKFSFEQDKSKGFHSAGTYYFSKGSYVKKYFTQLMDERIDLNGEYYISLVYNLLCRDNLKTYVYSKVPHFCQWGTPEDMEEYNQWSDVFNALAK